MFEGMKKGEGEIEREGGREGERERALGGDVIQGPRK